ADTASPAAIPEAFTNVAVDGSSTKGTASPPRPNDVLDPTQTSAPSPALTGSTSTPSAAAAAPSAQTPELSAPAPHRVEALTLTEPRLSAAEIAALVARGDAFVGMRDIASARLFYHRAVEAGDGRAALRMGATFDPAFLDQVRIGGAAGNQREAVSWYWRARDLGQ